MANPDFCGHCGRAGNVYGVMWIDGERVPLCHYASDGNLADPNCYHLVHDLGDELGRLKRGYTPTPDLDVVVNISPTGEEVDPDFSDYVDPTETQLGATSANVATKTKRTKRTAAQKDATNHPGVPFREAGNSPTGDNPDSTITSISPPAPVVGDELQGDPTPPATPVAAVVPTDDTGVAENDPSGVSPTATGDFAPATSSANEPVAE